MDYLRLLFGAICSDKTRSRPAARSPFSSDNWPPLHGRRSRRPQPRRCAGSRREMAAGVQRRGRSTPIAPGARRRAKRQAHRLVPGVLTDAAELRMGGRPVQTVPTTDTLSFGHHAEVAALPEHEQDHWLRKAGEFSWSTTRLRRTWPRGPMPGCRAPSRAGPRPPPGRPGRWCRLEQESHRGQRDWHQRCRT